MNSNSKTELLREKHISDKRIEKGALYMKVTIKEWRTMSSHNKQILLKAIANKKVRN